MRQVARVGMWSLLALGVLGVSSCKSNDPPNTELCEADEDCGPSMTCDDGMCVPKTPTTDTDDGDQPDTPDPDGTADFGDTCTKTADCKGTMECFLTPSSGRVCTVRCDGSDAEYVCPDPLWECSAFSGGGTDISHVCLPPSPKLCKPCEEDVDCGANGANLCIPQADGDFCGTACTDTGGCPTDYSCVEITRGGDLYYQCQPDAGRCIDCIDMDGDGYGVTGSNSECRVPNMDDCDDTDPQRYPGSTQMICDEYPTDCGPIADVQFINEDGVYNHIENCGTCGNSCYGTHVAAAICAVAGSVAGCQIQACEEGWADCDGNAANGCEADLSLVSSCGACGVTCGGSAASTASSLCTETSPQRYECAVTCNANYADCNGQPNDGCEADLRNPSFCGGCGNDCDAQIQNGQAGCSGGTCTLLSCDAGWSDCDGDPSNGCETDLSATDSCGGCGVVCGTAGTIPGFPSVCVENTANQTFSCSLACAAGRENCNGIPNDGCEADTRNGDLNNCGGCGLSCVYNNAATTCSNSNCVFQGCNEDFGDCDADMIGVGSGFPAGTNRTGCEVYLVDNNAFCGSCTNSCSALSGTWACADDTCLVNACPGDLLDCDSNPTVCESNRNDPATCGNCSTNCLNAPKVTGATCSPDSTVKCTITSCEAGYADCDGNHINGCEVSTQINVNNCGACGTKCELPNSVMECFGGACEFVECAPGWMNLSGTEATVGCNYQCSPSAGEDRPDDATVAGYNWQMKDTNCDGIDGDIARALFVDGFTGNDNNAGTRAAPLKTVTAALSMLGSSSSTLDQVYVSEGTYVEAITLVSGVSIYGGFKASDGWKRSPSNIATLRSTSANANRHVVAITGTALTGTKRTVVQNLSIVSGAATGLVPGELQGASSHGVHCTNCPSLSLIGNVIEAGNGASGGGATPPTNQPPASGGGQNGGNGDHDGSHRGVGGPGGSSSCGRAGGRGGYGGSEGANPGERGLDGAIGTPGGPGGNGGKPGQRGTNGASGANGTLGAPAAPGSNTGVLTSSFWFGVEGAAGAIGNHANGGGGGGGGGGQGAWNVNNGAGNGGGGGGGGGCGGLGGLGGGAGGASIAVLLVNSTGAIVRTNTLRGGIGGSGGAGSVGGPGGLGGGGGAGSTHKTSEIGAGANGGSGGQGGQGGGGGGGAGGPGIGIAIANTSLPTLTTTNTLVAGSPGGGGATPGGTAGPTGLTKASHVF